MPDGAVIAGLDVVIRILEDPQWKEKARRVKTSREMRQIILDFCEAHGRVVKIDKDTFGAYL